MSGSDLNGILNILKPPSMTSFDVVGYLRGLLKIKKIGHAGTLDPAAAGVLPICVGNATKAVEFMMDKDKVYRAELTLGTVTDTQDSTGQVLETREVNVSFEEIVDVLNSFKGKYVQVPPMYSALKVGGKKLYELARQGIEVERESRAVEIYSIRVLRADVDESRQAGEVKVLFEVCCSKGTYIRTLCADVGQKLGCGGHMSFLLRTRVGDFDISSSITLEEAEELVGSGRLAERLIPVEKAFKGLGEVKLAAGDERKFLSGAWIKLDEAGAKPGSLLKVYGGNGRFIALGEVVRGKGALMLKSKKQFI